MAPGVTAIYIDGNSVSCASMSQGDGGRLRIETLEHHEDDELLEIAKRLYHPVFMEVDCAVFKRKERLQQVIVGLLARRPNAYPVVGVLAPEKAHVRELEAVKGGRTREERWRRLLRHGRPANPLDYPGAFLLEETGSGDAESSRLLRFRLSDLIPLERILRKAAPVYGGLVTAQRALGRVARMLARAEPATPLTLCDVGKLRTTYSTVLPEGAIRENSIPVGLARDDQRYFRSFKPTLEGVRLATMTSGKMILTGMAGVLSLFPDETPTPQGEATRFALQVSRYATRSMESTLNARRDDTTDYPGRHFLAGRASRLAGLRQYMEEKTGVALRRLDRRPVAGLDLAPGLTAADLADCLVAVGGCLAALVDGGEPGVLLRHVAVPQGFQGRLCTVAELEVGELYLLEQGTQFT